MAPHPPAYTPTTPRTPTTPHTPRTPHPPPTPTSAAPASDIPARLTEAQVTEGFHAFLKSALAQAHAERLLTDEMLASAEADLMVEGPALCLFFAALRSPLPDVSVPLPPSSHSQAGNQPPVLNLQTCPPAFLPLFTLFSTLVPPIRALPPGWQHDLIRLLCSLDPLSSPLPTEVARLAGELRRVGIEISMRRTFQERFGGDLQAVLDRTGRGRKTRWEAPPGYEAAAPEKPLPPPPPGEAAHDEPHTPPRTPPSASLQVPQSPSRPRSPSSAHLPASPTPTPSFSNPSTPDPTLALIRETLYAALADTLSLYPSLSLLLTSDPARAYFASVSLSILHVCLTRISQDGEVQGVLGRSIREEEVSREYRGFMGRLVRIGLRAQLMGEEDDARAIRYAATDRPLPEPRLDRLRRRLLEGAGEEYGPSAEHGQSQQGEGEGGRGRRAESPSGSVTALANRINTLALEWVRLPAFRDRQGEVFEVLRGVGR